MGIKGGRPATPGVLVEEGNEEPRGREVPCLLPENTQTTC